MAVRSQRGARTGAPDAARVVDTRLVRLGPHDRRRTEKKTPPTAPPPDRPGRTRDRARLILPEALPHLITSPITEALACSAATADLNPS